VRTEPAVVPQAASEGTRIPSRPAQLCVVDLDDPRWRELVARAPNALPFHEPRWAQLLVDCYRLRGFAIGVAGADGRLTAGMPIIESRVPLRGRRWTSLPFTDQCPPLSLEPAGGDAEILGGLLEGARLDAGVSAVEVRAPLVAPGADVRVRTLIHRLELSPDFDELVCGYRSSVRQGIRVAAREGVVVRVARTRDDLTRTFYTLHVETHRRLGVPVQTRRFFELLWDRIVGAGLGFVLIASRAETALAAAVFLCGNRTLTYKYGASNSRFWPLRANSALFNHAIGWGCENGFRTFDWGRTDLGDDGLRRFKRSWGADELELRYTALGRRGEDLGASRLAKPLAAVVRRSPPFVCRATGAALYRYTA
jgi:CelD/BcsL family acetyltransferase involved in cellulose biosynthesis